MIGNISGLFIKSLIVKFQSQLLKKQKRIPSKLVEVKNITFSNGFLKDREGEVGKRRKTEKT